MFPLLTTSTAYFFFIFFSLIFLSLPSPSFPARLLPEHHLTVVTTPNDSSSTWDSFSRFLDAGRGTELSGMSELKKYLHRFGYLPITNSTNLTDIFDDQLFSALTLYQKNLGLAQTGKLDTDTLSTIMAPRCGMADNHQKTTRAHDLLHEHTMRHYAYFSGKPRWFQVSMLTYAFSKYYMIDQVSLPDIRTAFRRSFSRWSTVIPVNFTEIEDYQSADIRIGFYHGDHGDGEPFDGVLGVLAHAFSPENGRLHLDAAETWAVDFKAEKSKVAVDLESVATHEIGHVLGLAHTSVKDAVMYPSLSPRSKKIDLKIDDVEGVQALYGSNPNFKMSTLLESANSNFNDQGSGLQISFSRWINSLALFILFLFLRS